MYLLVLVVRVRHNRYNMSSRNWEVHAWMRQNITSCHAIK